jgi:hypothetical protein
MSLFSPTWTFTLSEATLRALARVQYTRAGGPQDVMRELWARVTVPEGQLTLEDEDLLKVYRYAYKYGQGGYQIAARLVLADAAVVGWHMPATYDVHEERPEHAGRAWDGGL